MSQWGGGLVDNHLGLRGSTFDILVCEEMEGVNGRLGIGQRFYVQRSTVVVGILSTSGERCGVPCRVYSHNPSLWTTLTAMLFSFGTLGRSQGSKRYLLPVTAARAYRDGCGREPIWRSPEIRCESASLPCVRMMGREIPWF